MITEEEQRKIGNRIIELVEELNKIRWELIGMSLKLIPAFKEDKVK